MIGGITVVLIVVQQNDSPSLLVVGNPGDRIDIIIQHKLLASKSFDLGIIPFPVIFILFGGQRSHHP